MSLPRDIKHRLATATERACRGDERFHVVAVAFDDDGHYTVMVNTRAGVDLERLAAAIRRIADAVEKP